MTVSRLLPLLVLVLLAGWAPSAAEAATCADHATQAAAQRAADTRDGDGDGRYCESLPCPCLGPGERLGPPAPARASCLRPSAVVAVRFSGARYPAVRRHARRAIADGWPRILVVNRARRDRRRDRLLRDLPSRPGLDRDEYPPAIGRGRANGNLGGLVRGLQPVGWRASVAYVPSGENRAHGASLGGQLRRYCDGTRFRYVFF